jgi:hypothetical protein
MNNELRSKMMDLKKEELPRLVFKKWEQDKKMSHCFTTRYGGISTGDLASLNLGLNRGDNQANVLENYKRVANIFDTQPENMVLSRQIHKTDIREVKKIHAGNGLIKPNIWESADGLYTTVRGIILVTHYADCVPLFFYAPNYQIIGMAHSGWRGTVEKIGAKMLQIWEKQYGICPTEIEVGIGPSIGPCCFEVGEDVAQIFLENFPDFLVKKCEKTSNKYMVDLWAANAYLLQAAGVPKNQIMCANLCTCCHHEAFFSHRYTHGKRGTLGAFMRLN